MFCGVLGLGSSLVCALQDQADREGRLQSTGQRQGPGEVSWVTVRPAQPGPPSV